MARLREGGRDYPYDEIRVLNPSRGLNTQVSDNMANDKDMTDGINVEYAEGGVVRKRPGFRSVSTDFIANPKGLGSYYTETVRELLSINNTSLCRINTSTGTVTNISPAVTFTPDLEAVFTVAKGKAYIWNGQEGGTQYDGTTATRPGTMPKAAFGIFYQGRQFVAGVPGQANRLYISTVSDPGDFTNLAPPTDPNNPDLSTASGVPGATVFTGTGADAIDIRKDDGDFITGLGIFQDILIIFKERAIYQGEFNDSGVLVVRMITNTYGCVSHKSIENVENDLYFLSRNGVYVLGNEPNYFAAIRTNELSARIKSIMEQIEPTKFNKCNAIYYDNRYWLSLPIGSTTVNGMVLYDRRFYAWTRWDTLTPNYMTVFVDDDKIAHLYYADDNNKRVCEVMFGSYSDDGVGIEARFTTRAFDGGKIDREKYWYALRPIFRQINGEITFNYYTAEDSLTLPLTINNAIIGGLGLDNFGGLMFGTSLTSTFTDLGLGLADSSATGANGSATASLSTNLVFDLPIQLDSRSFKFQVSNSTLNETFVLLGWVILFQEKDHQRFDGAYTYR